MLPDRIYLVRRAILRVLREYDPAQSSVDDILTHPASFNMHLTRDEVITQFKELTLLGYIKDIEGFNGELKRINRSGLIQINQEGEREIAIWGKDGRK